MNAYVMQPAKCLGTSNKNHPVFFGFIELEKEAGITYNGPEDLLKCKGTLQTLAKDICKVQKLATLAKTSQTPATTTLSTTASTSSISESAQPRQRTAGSLSASSSQSTLNPLQLLSDTTCTCTCTANSDYLIV